MLILIISFMIKYAKLLNINNKNIFNKYFQVIRLKILN
jgi:hypothetical protein